jgi:hypothetical protein
VQMKMQAELAIVRAQRAQCALYCVTTNTGDMEAL